MIRQRKGLHEYYNMGTKKFDFFHQKKIEIEFELHFDLCWRAEIIQVGLNMHLCVGIGDASSSLWGWTSSRYLHVPLITSTKKTLLFSVLANSVIIYPNLQKNINNRNIPLECVHWPNSSLSISHQSHYLTHPFVFVLPLFVVVPLFIFVLPLCCCCSSLYLCSPSLLLFSLSVILSLPAPQIHFFTAIDRCLKLSPWYVVAVICDSGKLKPWTLFWSLLTPERHNIIKFIEKLIV